MTLLGRETGNQPAPTDGWVEAPDGVGTSTLRVIASRDGRHSRTDTAAQDGTFRILVHQGGAFDLYVSDWVSWRDPYPRDGSPPLGRRALHESCGQDSTARPIGLRSRWVLELLWGATALANIAPFEARFRRTGRFGKTTVYLVPEPEERFTRLATAVAAAFPEYPPYGGAFSAVHPHLTLAHGVPEATLDAVVAAMDGHVDVRLQVIDVVLFFRDPNGRWTEGPHVPLPGHPEY